MDRDLLIRYLKHLDALFAALQAREHVEFQDVAPLRSELAGFRARLALAKFLDPATRRLFEGLDIRLDDKHLEGSRKTVLLNLCAAIGGSSPLLRVWRARKKAKVDAEVARIRAEIRNLVMIVPG